MKNSRRVSRGSQVITDFEAATDHCAFCFDVLIAHLTNVHSPAPEFEDGNCALFVTWNKCTSFGQSQLRGCIGTLEPRRLHTALKDYALTSALRDSRFSPVQLKEVAQLSCSVSLLSCFEEASSWQDWEVGQHGLIIEFTDPVLNCRRTATFLPEVAADQGWTKQQCIESLIRKAGFHGKPSSSLLDSLHVTRYQSSKAALSLRTTRQAAVAGCKRMLSSCFSMEAGLSWEACCLHEEKLLQGWSRGQLRGLLCTSLVKAAVAAA